MRKELIVVSMLLCSMGPATAQVSIGIGLPTVSIGINLSLFPELVPVPGYPVYYAPGLNSNYFFYDGMYWVYQDDNWYASSWYNGPWGMVGPEYVPEFILRVPVVYYRQPPMYFRGWQRDAAPRWGEHWGGDWERQRHGWDQWNHASAPAPAPLPAYQRQYSGDRYPREEQQHELRVQNYHYQPREPLVQEQYRSAPVANAPAAAPRAAQPAPAPQTARRGEQPAAVQENASNAPRDTRPQDKAPKNDAQRSAMTETRPGAAAPDNAPRDARTQDKAPKNDAQRSATAETRPGAAAPDNAQRDARVQDKAPKNDAQRSAMTGARPAPAAPDNAQRDPRPQDKAPQKGGDEGQRSAMVQARPAVGDPASAQRPPAPKSSAKEDGQKKAAPQEAKREQQPGKDKERTAERGEEQKGG